MNPKSHKKFKEGIAEEVGVHPNVVDDFIDFYYTEVRKNLTDMTYPRLHLDGLGTFELRRKKLEMTIKKCKDILGNIGKQTYKGYEKSVAVKERLVLLERIKVINDEMIKEKQDFKNSKKNETK